MTTLYMPDSRQCSSPVEASSKFAIFSFEFKKYFSRLKNQQLLAAGARRPTRGWDLKAPEIEKISVPNNQKERRNSSSLFKTGNVCVTSQKAL